MIEPGCGVVACIDFAGRLRVQVRGEPHSEEAKDAAIARTLEHLARRAGARLTYGGQTYEPSRESDTESIWGAPEGL